jgi:N-(5'phosphoribosyl)anthranilate (PRA) isomerase
VLEPASPRAAREVLPVPETVLSVAVFVGEVEETDADLVQLYEREDGKVRGRDAVFLREGEHVATVIDLPWEEEDETQLERARGIDGRLVLAGGLGPENVRRAIAATRPWAVDASSSLESSPGVKDHGRVRAYVAAARSRRLDGGSQGAEAAALPAPERGM